MKEVLDLVEFAKYGILALGWILFLLEQRQNRKKDDKIYAIAMESAAVLNAVKDRLGKPASRRR